MQCCLIREKMIKLKSLLAPSPLGMPNDTNQVRINSLRPIFLEDALQILEVNNPSLKAAFTRVEQSKFSLRATISSWYPTIDLSANGLPQYFKSYTYRNPDFVPLRTKEVKTGQKDPLTGEDIKTTVLVDGKPQTYGRQLQADLNLRISWDIINP